MVCIKNSLYRVLFFIATYGNLLAQQENKQEFIKTSFLTISQLTFESFLADPLESQMSVFYSSDRSLQFSLGSSKDIFQLNINDNTHTIGFGLEGNTSFLFQVTSAVFVSDVLDYNAALFVGYRLSLPSWLHTEASFQARLRLGYYGANFLDGNYDPLNTIWRGDAILESSRGVLDIAGAIYIYYARVYIAYKFSFVNILHEKAFPLISDPPSPHRFQIGLEVYYPTEYRVVPFGAIDCKILPVWNFRSNIDGRSYGWSINVQAGAIIGTPGVQKLKLVYNFFIGLNWRGIYYSKPSNTHMVGISLSI